MAINNVSSRAKQAMARRWPQFLEQKPRLTAFLIAGLAIAYGTGLTFRRATTPWSTLPDNDYWANIKGIITENGLTRDLAELFRYNNEHIVAIPKLVYAANYLLTGGSNVGLIVYSLFAGATCAILLLLLARDLLRDTPARWVLCALLFPLTMFSAKLSHSYYLGMSGAIWLTADIFVILSAAAMVKAAKMQNVAWLLASLLAALLGVLAYSTAIYSLLALLLFCFAFLAVPSLRGRFPWPALVATSAVLIAIVTLWLVHRPHPRGHPPLEFDPVGLAAFVLTYLGASISNGHWQPIMGFAILAAGALALWRLIAEGRAYDTILWVTLLLFAPFNGLMTGIGRLGFGSKAATSSRYQSVAAISLIAAMALVLASLPRDNSRRSVIVRAAGIVALALVAVFLAMNGGSVAFYASRLENKPVAEIALRQGIHGVRHLEASTKATGQITQLIPVLRRAQHVPFNTQTRCEAFMGQPLTESSGPTLGALEAIETYKVLQSEGTAIELFGWASQAGDPAECIAIADGHGKIIGAGMSGILRPEPASQQPLPIGWKAVATFPQSGMVCAYALFPESSVLHPLANCLAPE